MGIPSYLLPHTVKRIRPAVQTDTYNNEILTYDVGEGALEKDFAAWVQQDQRTQMSQENIARQGRYPSEERWLMVSNDDDVRWQDRILVTLTAESDELTFEVYAQPEPTFSPIGYHHTEATLRIVEG